MKSLDRRKTGQDLYSVLRPILWICRIFGIFPLWMKGPAGKREYSTSNILIIYDLIILILSITGLFMWTQNINESILEQWERTASMASVYLEFILQACSIVIMTVTAIVTRNKFADAILTLSSQDTTLRVLGTELDYTAEAKRSHTGLGMNISVMIFLVTLQFIYQSDFNSRHPSIWVAWMFPNVLRFVGTHLFADVLFATRKRFAVLNEHLREMTEGTEYFSPETLSTPNSSSKRLCLIARVHGTLSETVFSVTKTFGWNIVIGATCTLKILITATYHIIHEISDQNHRMMWFHVGGLLVTAVIGSAHIVYLITVCNSVRNEVSLSGKLIHKFEVDESPTPFNVILRSFSLQLYHMRMEFSAAGVFRLNATLLQSMVGALATFLIISMQFDTMMPEEIETRGSNNSLN